MQTNLTHEVSTDRLWWRTHEPRSPIVGLEQVSLAASGATGLHATWSGIEHALSAKQYDQQVRDPFLYVLMQSGFWRQVEGFTTFRAFREHVTLYVARSQGPLELTRQQLVEIVDGRVTNWADVGGPAARIHLCRLRPRSPRPKQYIAALDRKLDLALRGIGTSLKGARPMIEVESYAALAAAAERDHGILLFGLREHSLASLAPIAINGAHLRLVGGRSSWPLSFDLNLSIRNSSKSAHWLGVLLDTVRKRRAQDVREIRELGCR